MPLLASVTVSAEATRATRRGTAAKRKRRKRRGIGVVSSLRRVKETRRPRRSSHEAPVCMTSWYAGLVVSLPARPARLGPYEVIVKIAGGGMATIYLGKLAKWRGEERLAALKVIRHDLRHDERFVNMFLDEAKVLSRLSHPNIAATYEFGTDGDNQHYIAMELLVGRTVLDV